MLNKGMIYLKKIFEFFLPSLCALCHGKAEISSLLCDLCESEIPFMKHYCETCGVNLNQLFDKSIRCGSCLKKAPPFDFSCIAFKYEFPLNYFVSQLKFQHQLLFAPLLARLFVKHFMQRYQNEKWPELIIPVPLHKKRLAERGFNQSLEIAKHISRRCKIPLSTRYCVRQRNTIAQSLLPEKDRWKNMRGAFVCDKSLSVKHVAIFDDVMTTGATLNDLAKVLKRSGVARVDIWCVASTGYKRKS